MRVFTGHPGSSFYFKVVHHNNAGTHCSCSSCAIVQLCRHADSFHSVSIWAVQACITVGLLNFKTKTAQNLIGWGPPIISILPTVIAFMNDSNAEAGIPWWVHIVLGGAFPSYSFSLMLAIMLERSNDANGGLRLELWRSIIIGGRHAHESDTLLDIWKCADLHYELYHIPTEERHCY